MKNLLVLTVSAMLACTGLANAGIITFTDLDLASGSPASVGGVNLTTTTVGGSVGFLGSGQYAGLYLGGDNTSGDYILSFSQAITSIEIEFDALSSVGTPPEETIFNFATSNGPVTIVYTNQFGTTFDGTTITSTENDGQGIINFAGPSFTSFSFRHEQGAQAGFVIERIVINTADDETVVPEPGTISLLSAGLLVAFVKARKRSRS